MVVNLTKHYLILRENKHNKTKIVKFIIRENKHNKTKIVKFIIMLEEQARGKH